MGKWLSDEGIRPAVVLCSSARRTRETLDLIQDAIGPQVPIHIEPELYLADAPGLLARLHRLPRDVPSVLLIAHNPGLQELACELADAASRERLTRKFPTAALARFRLNSEDWRSLAANAPSGTVKLLKVITPAQLGGGKE
jgi:phosphohistidine phosphatase